MAAFKAGDTVICKMGGAWYSSETFKEKRGPKKGEECLIVGIRKGYLVLLGYETSPPFGPEYFEKKGPLIMTYKKREDIEKEHPGLILLN